jgi:GNAT superfamily N-acetyltransferase
MSYLLSNCRLTSLQDIQVQSNLSFFSCGDKDLDEFFQCDAAAYEHALFGKTYAFIDKRNNNITSMFTISNGGIQAKQMRRKLRENVPYPKRLIHNYPSVLIGRLAVSEKFQGNGIGSEILDFLKIWFSDSHNKTGCRFLAVDAYNVYSILKFYENNEFSFVFKSENEERASLQLQDGQTLHSRTMCCDLFPYAESLQH